MRPAGGGRRVEQWPVYRFNAAIWAARRYGHRLRLGIARRRGEAMRAAGSPCDHKGSDSAICETCGEVLCPYTPDERYWGLLTPCDWADMTYYGRLGEIDWGQDVWFAGAAAARKALAGIEAH